MPSPPLKFLATPLVAVALAFNPRFEIPKAKIVFTPMTSNLEFTAFLFDAEHYGDCMENKPASLSVVPLEKALGGIFESSNGRQIAGTPKRARNNASIGLS